MGLWYMSSSGSYSEIIEYTYTAYGAPNVYYTGNDLGDHMANANKMLYRGYYYDDEIGMYYLQSRFYDPEIGRFLSGDSYVSTGQGTTGFNMFAYCLNDPISFTDSSGSRPIIGTNASTETATERAASFEYMYATYTPGTSYSSADDAARAFSEEIYSSSLFARHEFGTVIYGYVANGKVRYKYATPVAGGPHGVDSENAIIPDSAKAVATAHTHPNVNGFSNFGDTGDIAAANHRHKDSYVVGPNGLIHKYTYKTRKTSVFREGINAIPLTARQRKSLVSKFQSSWNSHLAYCNLECSSMAWPTY